eukprot:1455053-Rhodomonas_salina.3
MPVPYASTGLRIATLWQGLCEYRTSVPPMRVPYVSTGLCVADRRQHTLSQYHNSVRTGASIR